MSSQNKTVKSPPAPTSPNGKAAEEIDDGVIDLTTSSNDGVHSPGGKSQRLHEKNNVFTCHSVQTLILVEDVDILFPEDHGCIAAIKHIAETAKGPIILTSNSEITCYNCALLRNIELLTMCCANDEIFFVN